MEKYNCVKEDLRFTEEVEKELEEKFNIVKTNWSGQYVNHEFGVFVSIGSYCKELGYNIYVSVHHTHTLEDNPRFAEVFDFYREVYFYVKGLK